MRLFEKQQSVHLREMHMMMQSFKFLWNMDDEMRAKVDEFKASKNNL